MTSGSPGAGWVVGESQGWLSGADSAVGCRLAVRGAFVGASLLFLLVNVLCAVLSRRRRAQPWALLLVRVLVSDSLFVICALSLAACLCLVARRAPSTSIYLEAKGTSVCQAAAMGGAMVLLYASRACYNLAALALAPRSRLDTFDYDWYNVSDQADLVNDLGNKGYLVFGLILFVWELLPTTLLVGFFRVHRPTQDLSTSRILNGQVFGSRSYFFDRTGHCEDEGCSWEHSRSESTRCWDQEATTTVSTPPHRRDPLLFSPEHPDPVLPSQASVPSSSAASCPGSQGTVATSSPRQLLGTPCSELVPSPRMEAMTLAARCPQHHGITCRLHQSQLPLLHLLLNKWCPCPMSDCCLPVICFVFLALLPVWPEAIQTLGAGLGRGHSAPGWWVGRGRRRSCCHSSPLPA
ncbi:integral membrane protein GPR137 isoform X4 [Manis pentadactyla]|uniref:integral membrane protein GPR137 isoform X4 n=1 Tax=Manis pentadactyla TaxID=143292 RepID=UPI00255C7428|nr:integral membrane protein GPR137 isoform X4 [Manis pentadactyla]XP_057362934.1 integral membrane protein GPR137 isoform X4 [Manis pentadactyla]